MKIALLSGAYVNAGDFLIENRSAKLILQNIPQADITILKRNIAYDVEELNRYDAIIFGGGPGFQKKIYPNRMPFVEDISKLSTPYYIMGWGWKGRNISQSAYCISKLSKEMLMFVKGAAGMLSCRDYYTIKFLEKYGITNTIMTGCPAWYNLDLVNDLRFKCPKEDEIKKICISDPASTVNVDTFLEIIQWVAMKYKDADIHVVFHRGLPDNIEQSCVALKNSFPCLNIDEISGGYEGFSIYDDCDLHIGFRVHAHIYNLSRGNVSYLINEDARGYGVNDALGCKNVDATRNGIILPRRNSAGEVINQLEQAIDVSLIDDNSWHLVADNIKKYHRTMQDFLKSIKAR